MTEDLLRDNIRKLVPYSTARDEYHGQKIDVFVDANENPYNTEYSRYPDPRQHILKEAISKLKGIGTEHIFIGNGSDEAIDLMYRLFCEPKRDNVIAIAPTYGMYKVAAEINDIEYRTINLREEDYALPPTEDILKLCDERTKLLWLCSPNNPTGNAFKEEDIKKILEAFKGITIIDEAYTDFCMQPSWLRHLDEYPRLVILQTFSKAWGLAGARCGMAFASETICNYMDRVKYPYNINQFTQQEVLRHLVNDKDKYEAEVKSIISEREKMREALSRCECVKKIYASDANFLLVKVDDAYKRYEQLLQAGVIARNRDSVCKDCLRITIGTPEENKRIISILNNSHH